MSEATFFCCKVVDCYSCFVGAFVDVLCTNVVGWKLNL